MCICKKKCRILLCNKDYSENWKTNNVIQRPMTIYTQNYLLIANKNYHVMCSVWSYLGSNYNKNTYHKNNAT